MRRLMRYIAAFGAALVLSLAFASPALADGPRHQVVNGDSLGSIADLYDVTVDELIKLNEIEYPDLILPGDVIKLPEPAAAPAPVFTEYNVEPGDTLSHIAVRFDVTVEDLAAANEIADVQLINPGRVLKVPVPPPSQGPEGQLLRHPPKDALIEKMFDELAAAEGLNPGLLKALAWTESGWQQHVVSPAGAIGYMQLTPVTVQWLEQSVFGAQLNEDVSSYDNVKMGARYLRILKDATGDDDKALASYYQGYGTTSSGVMYEETKHYVELVRAVKERYWPD